MLTTTKIFSGYSVNDLAAAKEFYADKLGLQVEETPEGLSIEIGKETHVFLYEKKDHAPATFTVLNFIVSNIKEAVTSLNEKGIHMEQYDMPDFKTDEHGVFRGDRGPKAIAWFKDPSSNILSVLEG